MFSDTSQVWGLVSEQKTIGRHKDWFALKAYLCNEFVDILSKTFQFASLRFTWAILLAVCLKAMLHTYYYCLLILSLHWC